MSYSKADSVYSAINGDYIDKEDYIIDGIEVANAFEDGSVCSKYYENIYRDYFTKRGRMRKTTTDPIQLVNNIKWKQFQRQMKNKYRR